MKKELVNIFTGYQLSGGVDSEGELHLWGKKENMVIPEKHRRGNEYGISNQLTCILKKDATIGCFGKALA